MKKFAFTLMELLMSLAVIGITAALVAPALSNIMPDKTKMQVIKAHKVLADVTHDLLNDPMYYYDYIPTSTRIHYRGLTAYSDPDAIRFSGLRGELSLEDYRKKYTNTQKYCYLLADKLETSSDVQKDGEKCSFSLIDGTKYVFEAKARSEQKQNNGVTDIYLDIDYTVTIDLNGDKGPNTIATSKDVKNPDQFMFNVDTYGKITAHPDDKLTAQYLKTPTKFNNKKEDYKAAFGS